MSPFAWYFPRIRRASSEAPCLTSHYHNGQYKGFKQQKLNSYSWRLGHCEGHGQSYAWTDELQIARDSPRSASFDVSGAEANAGRDYCGNIIDTGV